MRNSTSSTNVRSKDVVRGDTLRSTENFPLEVVMLLDVLSRIESRRQAKLFAAKKGVQ